jgi:hypothetical protein
MRLPVVGLPSALPDIAEGNVLPLDGLSFAQPMTPSSRMTGHFPI